MRKTPILVFAIVIMGASFMMAQTNAENQAPRERLNYFAGTWSVAVHMKTGALNSRAYFGTEHNEWVSDHSLLLSRPDGDGVLSVGGLSVTGYSTTKKAYTYHIVKGRRY